MFIQDGKHIIQGYVCPTAPHNLSRIPLQGSDGVGEEGTVSHPAQPYTVKSHLQLWYVMASFVSSSLKMVN